ncbi:hypothetical protein BED47_03915 [Gottfriedia luciferensis]|uniref:DUF3221 domain-containing protein n=1 Tax=Gottfriedia luciferensis TaxID=178774 RepID=A0ABX2ZVJ4_9BACI|nr:hypothetical protein [Gottfriedia luciferensis]ODG93442.1 hypothetical protein BED47_03915 [Gottfriedia luciferensis]
MKLRGILLTIIALTLLFTGYRVFSSTYKPVNNSTTFSAKVIDKIQSKDKYIIEVVDVNNNDRTGKVIVNDENVWNLIENKREYFMVVNYKSSKMYTPIFSEGKATLQQIEIVK